MISEMYLQYFTAQKDFPFYIQYGHHDENMFLHNHADFSELVFVLGGHATHIVNDEEYPIQKGVYLSSTKIHPTPIRIRVISGSVILCFNRTIS